jgi:hypothetical protein
MATIATRPNTGSRPHASAPLATQLESSLRAAVDAVNLVEGDGLSPASLRQELQQILLAPQDSAAMMGSVMALVCRVSGALLAAYFERDEQGRLTLVAQHRDARLEPTQAPDAAALEQGAALACSRAAVQVARVQPWHSAVAVPLGTSRHALGAVSLLLPSLEVHDARQTNFELLLAWLAGWLCEESRRRSAWQAHTAEAIVELSLELNRARNWRQACSSLVGKAQSCLGCRQVALGLRRGARIRIAAVSDVAQIKCETELVRALENCLDETLARQNPIVWPAAAHDLSATVHNAVAALPAHRQLAAVTGARAAASATLRSADGGVMGAWVLLADEPFAEPDQTARLLAAAAGPIGAGLDAIARRRFTWSSVVRAVGVRR